MISSSIEANTYGPRLKQELVVRNQGVYTVSDISIKRAGFWISYPPYEQLDPAS